MTTAADLIAKARRLKEETAACREYWLTTLPEQFLPEDRQFQLWLNMYGGLDNVIAGLERVQQWLQQIDQQNAEWEAENKSLHVTKTKIDVVKYGSGVMRNVMLGIEPSEGENAEEKKARIKKRYKEEYQKRPGDWSLGEDVI